MTFAKLRRSFPRFLRNSSGAPVVEFALIAPAIALAVVVLIDVANIASAYGGMQRAARAGTQYYMNGGTDDTAAQAVVTGSWTKPPAGGTISLSTVCTCGSGSVSCSGTCLAGAPMQKNITVTVAGLVRGTMISLSESAHETVRVN